MIFVSVDGDDIGNYLEYLILRKDIEALKEFSKSYREAMIWLDGQVIEKLNASLIFSGGDNSMFAINDIDFSMVKLEEIRSGFNEKTGKTVSIGVGLDPREAYFALKLAKTSGKDSIHSFEELD